MTRESQRLVEDNHNLIYKILKNTGLTEEDYYDLAAIGLCKAAETYNTSKYEFSTYAYKCMYNEIHKEKWRKNSLQKFIPDALILHYDKSISDESDTAPCFEIYMEKRYSGESQDDVLAKLIYEDYYNGLRKDRDREILDLFQKGYSHQKIAEIINCPVGTVARVKRLCKEYMLSS